MAFAARIVAALGGLLLAGSAANATPQHVPSATERLHTSGSGQPGAEWNTAGLGAGGDVSYSSTTGILSVEAVLDVLNYYDPNDVSCPTDVGSNCADGFALGDLDIAFEAQLTGITATSLGGPFVGLQLEFGSVAGGGFDLEVTDPDDGNSVQLQADLLSGTFGGTPTDGLQASIIYNASLGTAVFDDVNSVGVFGSLSGPFATLFGTTQIGLNLGTLSDFSPTLDTLGTTLAASCPTPTPAGVPCDLAGLSDFTAEANAQIFRTETGQFVPEPGTLALMASAIVGLLMFGRRY